MTTLDDLTTVLKETLESRGVLGQVRARIRAELFKALDEDSAPKPKLSNENLLINELIREYLEFNRYQYTRSVLLSETGQPKEPLDRRFLTRELGIADDDVTTSVPLLYALVGNRARVRDATRRSPPIGNDDDEMEDDSLMMEDGDDHAARPGRLLVCGGRGGPASKKKE
ncbi:centrosomal protein 20-like [Oscarella lobularis]|uniref:centrosomal protein 20-like n=1 Tax=Oscarella lobularis TaxID=121494 RepID=UPI003313BF6D